MKGFELDGVQGTIRPCRLLNTSLESAGDSGKPQRMTDVEIAVELGEVEGAEEVDQSFFSAAGKVFPFADKIIQIIAGEEERQGCDLTARAKLTPLTLDICSTLRGAGDKPDLHIASAACVSKPKLKISEAGEAVICLKLKATLDKAGVHKLSSMIGNDVWVTAQPSQMDMIDEGGKVVATIGKTA